MVGWATEEILLSKFDQIFHKAPAGKPVISIVHAVAYSSSNWRTGTARSSGR
jgi:hypothetical protein